MNYPVFDLHCDTALALLNGSSNLLRNNLHVDLVRAGELPGYVQCFACFTTTLYDNNPSDVFLKELETIQKQIAVNAEKIRLVHTANEVEQNLDQGISSAILTIEGPAGFDFDPSKLEELYGLGFRITSLGWNEKNPLAGSHKTGGGLTDQGREYVKEAQRLGMIVDVSHISDEAFWDIMDITEAPIIATHSNSRAVCGHSRNLTDDMFLHICKTGGVAGFNMCDAFVGENPDLNTICDHFLHFMELDPDGKHIALGGDLDGCDVLPKGFDGVQSYPVLVQQLLNRGLSEENIRNIYWNNALGVMKRCCI